MVNTSFIDESININSAANIVHKNKTIKVYNKVQ